MILKKEEMYVIPVAFLLHLCLQRFIGLPFANPAAESLSLTLNVFLGSSQSHSHLCVTTCILVWTDLVLKLIYK